MRSVSSLSHAKNLLLCQYCNDLNGTNSYPATRPLGPLLISDIRAGFGAVAIGANDRENSEPEGDGCEVTERSNKADAGEVAVCGCATESANSGRKSDDKFECSGDDQL